MSYTKEILFFLGFCAFIYLLTMVISSYSAQTFNINIHTKTSVISLEDEQEVFAANVAKLIDYITAKGYHVTVGEAYRTEEQAMIYAHEGKGIVNSLHRKRLAVDLNIFAPNNKMLTTVEDLSQFGDYWESLNEYNVWGGRWVHRPDLDHYQMSDERRQ